jgi:hypothetical protein
MQSPLPRGRIKEKHDVPGARPYIDGGDDNVNRQSKPKGTTDDRPYFDIAVGKKSALTGTDAAGIISFTESMLWQLGSGAFKRASL